MSDLNNPITRLRAALPERLDAIAVTPGATLTYLTGFPFHASERLTLLIVPREGEPVVLLPNFEESNWRDNVGFDARLLLWDDTTGPAAALRKATESLTGLKRCAIESLVMRVFEIEQLRTALPHSEFVDGASAVLALRSHKRPHEIDAMRRAIQIAEDALDELLRGVKVGSIERALSGRLCSLLFEGGGEGISFGPIVLSGRKSALPHGVPDDRAVQRGELLLIDFGTSYNGYHCDITRTFVVGADPDQETRRIYEAVRTGNAAGCVKCGPGVTNHAVHHAAQDHFRASDFQAYSTHRTGHGLGLDIHEPPSVMDGNLAPLEPGNVITVEPGLYRDGWGGVRIEDDVLITESGAEILTTFPRELRVVG